MSYIARIHDLYEFSWKLPKRFYWYLSDIKNFFSSIAHALSVCVNINHGFTFLQKVSHEALFRMHAEDGAWAYFSKTIEELTGYDAYALKGIGFDKLVIESWVILDGKRYKMSCEKLRHIQTKSRKYVWHVDHLIKTQAGEKRWLSEVAFPWSYRGEVIGFVGKFTDITKRIEADHHYCEQLLKLAHTDELTGLANRREFYRCLDHELARIKRSHAELSILLIDFDHFKRINDTYGHAIGDKMLVQVARVIQSIVRESDIVARLGGEEFAVFLPDTPQRYAYTVAERIRGGIENHLLLTETNSVIGCTASIGLATANWLDQYSADTLLKVADTRLYAAKNAGRNKVFQHDIINNMRSRREIESA